MNTLENRWQELWSKLGFPKVGDPQGEQFRDLIKHYCEPHRHYHTLKHIENMLNTFNEVKDLVHDPLAVELAIWYHDFIYNPKAGDNEAMSAVQFLMVAQILPLNLEFRQKIAKMIIDTKHDGLVEDHDTQILLDIDLSILGQPREIFDRYEVGVRFEYQFVPMEVFNPTRAKILKMFLAKPDIYKTPSLKDRFERTARENLAYSIAKLAS